MKSVISLSHIMLVFSLLSSGLFLASAIFLGKEYRAYQQGQQEVSQLEAKVSVQRKVVQDHEEELAAIKTTDGFMKEAQRLGLTPESWQKFQAVVERGTSFHEAAQILGQACNTNDYYFLPSSFKLERPEEEKKVIQTALAPAKPSSPPQAKAKTVEPSPKPATEDLLVTVNGAFWVKKQ